MTPPPKKCARPSDMQIDGMRRGGGGFQVGGCVFEVRLESTPVAQIASEPRRNEGQRRAKWLPPVQWPGGGEADGITWAAFNLRAGAGGGLHAFLENNVHIGNNNHTPPKKKMKLGRLDFLQPHQNSASRRDISMHLHKRRLQVLTLTPGRLDGSCALEGDPPPPSGQRRSLASAK